MTTGTARLVPLVLDGPAGPLEALLQEREGETPSFVALVLHPHPLFGGTMHNKVVHRVASTLHELGATVLRINFRGVGRSAGAHDRGHGELEDAAAALQWLRARHPGARAWLAGFSFGAWVASRLAARDGGVERLLLVGPPVATQNFEAMRGATVPKLVIQGAADTTCPPAALEREFPSWAEPKTLVWVPGATHFFDRQLAALGDAVRTALAPHVAAGGGR
jgi:alpha/beta superfamily hydrolase